MEALGNVEQALRHYLKALDLVHTNHPRYDVVYANLADLMLKLGEYQKAFDLAAEAAQRNPEDPRNFFLTGKALVQLERYDLSVRWLERAAALDPSYPEPKYVLAHATGGLAAPPMRSVSSRPSRTPWPARRPSGANGRAATQPLITGNRAPARPRAVAA